MKNLLFFIIICLAPTMVFPQNIIFPQNPISKAHNNYFIQNKGQWPKEVLYLAKIGGLNAWITNSGVVYDFFRIEKKDTLAALSFRPDHFKHLDTNFSIKGHVVKMEYEGKNDQTLSSGQYKQDGYYNYFIGNDSTKWASFVPLYGEVTEKNIYPGIDNRYYFDSNRLRYDIVINPGADLQQLKMKYTGQDGLSLNENGELVLKTSLGEVTQNSIYAYQEINGIKQKDSCKFKITNDGSITFDVENYNSDLPLIIDPLIFSTYLGGNENDFGFEIQVDKNGNSYVTGFTRSINFPITTGAYQKTNKSSISAENCFVTKLNATGTALVFSTYLVNVTK